MGCCALLLSALACCALSELWLLGCWPCYRPTVQGAGFGVLFSTWAAAMDGPSDALLLLGMQLGL